MKFLTCRRLNYIRCHRMSASSAILSNAEIESEITRSITREYQKKSKTPFLLKQAPAITQSCIHPPHEYQPEVKPEMVSRHRLVLKKAPGIARVMPLEVVSEVVPDVVPEIFPEDPIPVLPVPVRQKAKYRVPYRLNEELPYQSAEYFKLGERLLHYVKTENYEYVEKLLTATINYASRLNGLIRPVDVNYRMLDTGETGLMLTSDTDIAQLLIDYGAGNISSLLSIPCESVRAIRLNISVF